MNANRVAKHYACLTAEERFRLIVAAGGRGDDAERDRLVQAGARLTLTMPDHAPYANALRELAVLVYIELLEEAARYREAFDQADDARERLGSGSVEEEGNDEADNDAAGDAPNDQTSAGLEEDDEAERSPWLRYLDLALAAGYTLRTKADGWRQFCERLNISPLLLWEALPGFDRLQQALALAEVAAFVPEGCLRWLNRIRPKDTPPLTHLPLTVAAVAAETERMFHERVAWWSGGGPAE